MTIKYSLTLKPADECKNVTTRKQTWVVLLTLGSDDVTSGSGSGSSGLVVRMRGAAGDQVDGR